MSVQRFPFTLGDGISTAIEVRHGLQTKLFAGPPMLTDADGRIMTQNEDYTAEILDNNWVRFTFAVAPAQDAISGVITVAAPAPAVLYNPGSGDSDFDDDILDGLVESLNFIGTTEFQIGDQTYRGDLDELGDRAYEIVAGGKQITVVSHLLCEISQFEGDIPQDGRLKIGAQLFTIAAVSQDKASVSFTLADPDAG